ncbi:MAG: hypothetical protein NUW07_00105 [Candidatus Saccharicenans sp.]|jgi:hypothetical protein|nr:hypothetical protein [Candidatus Saccharicenans sp.]MDH7493137.1 hypothetical protein [Candidatus Saccharicenans sp.]
MREKKIGQWIFNSFLILCLSSGLLSPLQADTSARSTFSVELKEWLVLEMRSGANRLSDTGNFQASGETEFVSGQALEIRALLSVSEGKRVALKGIIYRAGAEPEDHSVLHWYGLGDLQGEGMISPGQEGTFAVWEAGGWRSGSLVFEETEQLQSSVYRAIFIVSAI